MHRCDVRQQEIVCIERARYRCEPAHKRTRVDLRAVGTAEQPSDFVRIAHDKAVASSLNERRVAENQAFLIAGEAEIVRARFAQMPDRVKHARLSLHTGH
jgi:hypothetical protein